MKNLKPEDVVAERPVEPGQEYVEVRVKHLEDDLRWLAENGGLLLDLLAASSAHLPRGSALAEDVAKLMRSAHMAVPT